MAAYIVADIEVTDSVAYSEYRALVAASLEAYGGRFLVRGGAAERLEGKREPQRMVVLEFESLKKARAWWSSSEYAPAKAIRERASRTEMIVVDGV